MTPHQQAESTFVASAADAKETTLSEWRIHFARREPRKLLGIAAVACFAALVGSLTFHQIGYSLVGAGLILVASSEFLFPITYRLTNKRATVAYGLARLELPWDRVQRIQAGADTVRLLPLKRPSRLDGSRGVTLRTLDESHRLDVIKLVTSLTQDAGNA